MFVFKAEIPPFIHQPAAVPDPPLVKRLKVQDETDDKTSSSCKIEVRDNIKGTEEDITVVEHSCSSAPAVAPVVIDYEQKEHEKRAQEMRDATSNNTSKCLLVCNDSGTK